MQNASKPKSGSSPQPGDKRKDPPGFAARKAAADVLGNVVYKRRPLDGELDAVSGHAGFKALAGNDRALVRAILGTCLRRRGELNEILSRVLDRKIPEKTGRVVDILHVALAQMLYMDVPDRAAVSLAVEHAGFDRRAKPYKGLVNGVLRRIGRERDELITDLDVRLNTPDWLYDGWVAAYGRETAKAICEAHQNEAALDLTVKSDPEGWAEKLGGTVVGAGSVRLEKKGSVEALEGFEAGEWWVQDAAASLPARLLGDVSGKSVADLCAAPGGKTLQLAAAGGNVTAVDISKSRLKRVTENLKRMKLEATVEAGDLRAWEPKAPFDGILLDAPCSATGTIRRHPDVNWLKQLYDVETLSAIQAELLRRTFDWLKPGGVLVYCTCSLEKAEGEDQIAAFLSERSDAKLVPVEAAEIGGLTASVTEEGYLRTLPSQPASAAGDISGLDGFFAARLQRL